MHGLVIGKFYPPHKGHKFLIDTARRQVERLTVIVCDHPSQDIPAEKRVEWLREIHPDVDVVVTADDLDDNDSRAWAGRTIEVLGKAPDVVFTSEAYGDTYAACLGCRHVCVDPGRHNVPISGSGVRLRPLDRLDYLEPCVRAHFVKRVCLVGAESSGTTTMAQALAAHYDTDWVPEYGREHSLDKFTKNPDDPWRPEEFVHIAQEQCRREDTAARTANKILICDTDALATSIWHQRYMGSKNTEVETIANARTYDLYLLTDIDIPFVQDGTRDGESIRQWMHDEFVRQLESSRLYALLAGSHRERLAEAVRLIDSRCLRRTHS